MDSKEEQDSLYISISGKYADCRENTMEILMTVKAAKENFSTKESTTTALTNQQRFYKYKTSGSATH